MGFLGFLLLNFASTWLSRSAKATRRRSNVVCSNLAMIADSLQSLNPCQTALISALPHQVNERKRRISYCSCMQCGSLRSTCLQQQQRAATPGVAFGRVFPCVLGPSCLCLGKKTQPSTVTETNATADSGSWRWGSELGGNDHHVHDVANGESQIEESRRADRSVRGKDLRLGFCGHLSHCQGH